jgi:hypothetical protein
MSGIWGQPAIGFEATGKILVSRSAKIGLRILNNKMNHAVNETHNDAPGSSGPDEANRAVLGGLSFTDLTTESYLHVRLLFTHL